MEPETGAPVDIEHLRRYTFGDAKLEREILELFAANAQVLIDSLDRAQNPQDWRSATHGLKGSACAIGAHTLADLAALAERIDFSEPGARQHHRAALNAAIATVCDYVAASGHR